MAVTVRVAARSRGGAASVVAGRRARSRTASATSRHGAGARARWRDWIRAASSHSWASLPGGGSARYRPRYAQWVYDVLDTWLIQTGHNDAPERRSTFDEARFGNVSA